ncbi:MAG: diguanylate cyclase [Mariprofundaceae bacterium]|nr:diguanylate cyclase [Mariprofundaceae bacterium]
MNVLFAKVSLKQVLSWRFVLLLLPCLAIFTALTFYHEEQEKQRYLKFIEHKELLQTQKLQEELFLEVEHLSQTLLSLSQYATGYDMMDAQSLQAFHMLLKSVLKSNHHIDSLSFFDPAMQEVLHVSYQLNSDTFDCDVECAFPVDLAQDTLFISGLRLKKVQGKVSHPLTPVMQLVMPVFSSDGIKKGFVVLNHLNQHLYQQLDWANKDVPSQTMLLNKDAYWLYHPERKYEWGSSLKLRQHLRLSHQNAQLWERIQREKHGSFYDHGHLYTFQSVDVAVQLNESLSVIVDRAKDSAMPWVILSKYPYQAMQEQWNHQQNIYLYAFVAVLLAGVLFMWCYALEHLANMKRHLQQNDYYLKQIQSLSAVGSWSWSEQKLHFSEQANCLFGIHHQHDMKLKSFLVLVHPEDRKKVKLKLLECMNDQVDYHMIHRIIRQDDQVICTVQCKACVCLGEYQRIQMIGVMQDISAQLHEKEQMRALVQQDTLTKIPNRSLFMDRLGQNILYSQRESSRFAFLYIRLFDFKGMKQRLDTAKTDLILCEISQRLGHAVRSSDTVARIAVDVFAILLRQTSERHDLVCICNNLRAILNAPICVDDQQEVIEVAIGIACFPNDGRDLDVLSIHADQALVMAEEKKNTVFYSDMFKSS